MEGKFDTIFGFSAFRSIGPLDQLFKKDDDWRNNALIEGPWEKWTHYIHGYKRAGDFLCAHMIETERNEQTLIYPIVFLYRQYLELLLKRILQDGFLLLEKEQSYPKTHNLVQLWNQAKAVMGQIWEGNKDTKAELQAIGRCISELADLDLESFAFRYPYTKDDKHSLPDLGAISVKNLADVVTRIGSLLEGASCGISDYLEQKIDIERAMEDRF